jgi:hypothetical protein
MLFDLPVEMFAKLSIQLGVGALATEQRTRAEAKDVQQSHGSFLPPVRRCAA